MTMTDARDDAGQTEPVPVAAPLIGLAGAGLCALCGLWLLLAPFALDYRHGARDVPRATVIDLVTGGAALLVALLATAGFAAAVRRRLRAAGRLPQPAEEPAGDGPAADDTPDPAETFAPPEPTEPTGPTVPSQSQATDELRDLLAPLVAALAADLQARRADDVDTRTGGA